MTRWRNFPRNHLRPILQRNDSRKTHRAPRWIWNVHRQDLATTHHILQSTRNLHRSKFQFLLCLRLLTVSLTIHRHQKFKSSRRQLILHIIWSSTMFRICKGLDPITCWTCQQLKHVRHRHPPCRQCIHHVSAISSILHHLLNLFREHQNQSRRDWTKRDDSYQIRHLQEAKRCHRFQRKFNFSTSRTSKMHLRSFWAHRTCRYWANNEKLVFVIFIQFLSALEHSIINRTKEEESKLRKHKMRICKFFMINFRMHCVVCLVIVWCSINHEKNLISICVNTCSLIIRTSAFN